MTFDLNRWQIVVGVVLAGISALLVGTPHPILAVVPAIVILGGLAVTLAPSALLLNGILFLLLVLDNPRERPHMALWRSPLYEGGTWLYDTLQKKGFGPVKLFGLEAALIIAMLVIVGRWVGRSRDEPVRSLFPVSPQIAACICSAGMIVAWELLGLARGGVVERSIAQFRPMLFAAVAPLLYLATIRTRRQVMWTLTAIIAAGTIRAFFGFVFWAKILRFRISSGVVGSGRYATMHSDTIIFSVCVILCIFAIVHRVRWAVWTAIIALPILAFAIHINNRRLVYVALGVAMLMYYAVTSSAVRYRIHRIGGMISPVIILYLIAGWNSNAGWAAPAAQIHSLFEQSDGSSISRDIENINLLFTTSHHPWGGYGFGHEYVETIKSVDLAHIFEAFRFLPHNNIFWLTAAGGALGYTLFWVFLVTSFYLAARLYRESNDTVARQSSLGLLACGCAYGMQAYGDMGLQSWSGSVLMATLIGMVAVLTALHDRGELEVEPSQSG